MGVEDRFGAVVGGERRVAARQALPFVAGGFVALIVALTVVPIQAPDAEGRAVSVFGAHEDSSPEIAGRSLLLRLSHKLE